MTILSQAGRSFNFNGTSIQATTQYVYTATGSYGVNDGWIQTMADHVLLQTCVGTLTATTVYLRVEGKYDGGLDRIASLYTTTVTAAQTIDAIELIEEHVKEIRVGVKVTSTYAATSTAPNNFYAGLCLVEER